MKTQSTCLLPLVFAALVACQPVPSTTAAITPAHTDSAIAAADAKAQEEIDTELAGFIARAKATFPDVKQRYLAGLPPGHALFVTTRVPDDYGKMRDAFVSVESIREGRMFGTIATETGFLTGVRKGQRYSLTEEELIDWIITSPSGDREGNFVGQFIESKRKKTP